MKKNSSFAAEKHDLAGYAALDFIKGKDFKTFAGLFTGNKTGRYTPVALRFFIKGGKPVVTLYAFDDLKSMNGKMPKGKVPVRKFKLKLTLEEFLQQVKQFDFTVTSKGFEIEKLLVLNK